MGGLGGLLLPLIGLLLLGVWTCCVWTCLYAVAPAQAAELPSVTEQWATSVSATAATLNATVNPKGLATTYRFEYAASEAALLDGEGAVVPAPPAEGEAGEGNAGIAVQVHPQGLVPRTSYWYRVVSTSAAGKVAGCETTGTCPSFTAQALGEASLPEARAWEQVSPALKDGALIVPSGESGGLVQAAQEGGAVTYLSVGAATGGPKEQPAGNAKESQLLSIRSSSGGWSSQDIATPHEVVTGTTVGIGQEYRWFAPDLGVGLVEPLGTGQDSVNSEGAALLSRGASEKTIYLRDDTPLSPPGGGEQLVYGAAEIEAADPEAEAGYLPLVTGCGAAGECRTPRVEELADVAPGTKFGGSNNIRLSGTVFVGASPDGSHVVFFTETPLEEGAKEGLYEWSAGGSLSEPGRLRLVSIATREGKEEQASSPALGAYASRTTEPPDARGAISDNGDVIFSESAQHLFMRDTADEPERTVQLDEVQPGVTSPGAAEAEFQFASADGRQIFFTDGQKLTTTSNAGGSSGRDLYECEMQETPGGPKCQLKDLTAGAAGAGVQGFVAAGSGSSAYVYFVATAKLTGVASARGEFAQAGADNLYMLHHDEETGMWEAPTLVAVLAAKDSSDWGSSSLALEATTVRVSPDGRYLAFMSERSLTGYDNVDASSPPDAPREDDEVYLYRAPSADAPPGSLVCVSCNPTDERPSGVQDLLSAREGQGLLVDKQEIWTREGGGRWLAGSVPGWTAMAKDSAEYQSRYLSNEGRVFFDSPDDLVPQATNGLENVYEYRPAEVAGCEGASATFSAAAEGCVALISSGKSSEESVFLDASGAGVGGEEGEDVFFLTSQSLVATDKDTAFDVYDAHVCTAQAPCRGEATSPPPCGTAESCRLAPASQPSIYGAPPSVAFTGEGNPQPMVVVTGSSQPKTCPKGRELSGGKCVKRKAKPAKRDGHKARRRARKAKNAHKGRSGR